MNQSDSAPIHPLRRLIRNSAFSSIATLLTRVANIVIFVAISRRLGIHEAGTYSLSIGYFFIGARFAAWGLDHILTRDVAQDHSLASRYFWNFVALRILLSVGVIILLALTLRFLPYETQTQIAITIMLAGILPENVTNICQSQ
ncbi:oligosaccharide flippase family protein [Chloroflexi bacterium TSY]|nr:oligosaccharide flippase family protein [Chloroflexi bacterium TSY]